MKIVMKIVYIAGPFRGETAWDIERNVRLAETAALEVARLGAMPMCPHTNTRFFHGQCTEFFWVEGTLELLRRCDAVLLVGEWQKSSGSRGEEAEAARLSLPIFQDLEKLHEWLVAERELAYGRGMGR